MDFESAAHGAAKAAFPQVRTYGCFFHLGQALWKRVQDEGLRLDYTENPDVRLACKMLLSLAFVRPDRVVEVFLELEQSIEDEVMDLVEPVFQYFERNYIGRRVGRRQVRRMPEMEIEVWNVRNRTVEGIPRTQNQVEGWHRGIQSMFDGYRPTIWSFLAGLQREQVLQHGELVQLRAGGQGRRISKKYAAVNNRLKNVIERSGMEEDVDFLRTIAYNIEVDV